MDPLDAFNAAQATRRDLQAAAGEMGVTEDYISLLVDSFYLKVQAHPELGPVFNEVIQDRWPVHLEKMKRFWSSIALRTGVYSGRPMQAHRALTNAHPDHFGIWLTLFEQTLHETAPTPEAAEYFMGFARNMAARLQKGMFG